MCVYVLEKECARVCVCVCVCVCAHACVLDSVVCVCVCMCTRAFVYVGMRECVCLVGGCACVGMSEYENACLHVCMHILLWAFMCANT